MPAKLYLIPNTIGEDESLSTIAHYRFDAVRNLQIFFVEEEKSARAYLKKAGLAAPIQECRLFVLSEHTKWEQKVEYLDLIKKNDTGIISGAGNPCIADPGSDLVLLAHQNSVEVVPLIGPSSILLALIASGLNGQNFAFNGYLPKEREERIQKIRQLERRSLEEDQTQIFMETPYHNDDIVKDVVSCCDKKTLFCVACNLTQKDQCVKTMTIKGWETSQLSFNKKPAIFILKKPK